MSKALLGFAGARTWLLVLLAVTQIGAVQPATSAAEDFEPVSLLAILANPIAYDGKRVRVQGFLTLIFEGDGLYLDKEAYEAGLAKNAIWIDSPAWRDDRTRRRLSMRYAVVEGTFNARKFGHMRAYSGVLEGVQNMQPTFTNADFRQYKVRESNGFFLQQVRGPGLLLTMIAVAAAAIFAALRFARRRKT